MPDGGQSDGPEEDGVRRSGARLSIWFDVPACCSKIGGTGVNVISCTWESTTSGQRGICHGKGGVGYVCTNTVAAHNGDLDD